MLSGMSSTFIGALHDALGADERCDERFEYFSWRLPKIMLGAPDAANGFREGVTGQGSARQVLPDQRLPDQQGSCR